MEIFEEKKYRKIFFDFRPPSDGHPLDWLSHMIDAKNARSVREISKLIKEGYYDN